MSQMESKNNSAALANNGGLLIRPENKELPPAVDPGREAFRNQVAEMKSQNGEPSLKDAGKEALHKLATDLRGKFESLCNFAKPHVDNAIQAGKEAAYTAVGAVLDPKTAYKQTSERAQEVGKEIADKAIAGGKWFGKASLEAVVVGGAAVGALTKLTYGFAAEKVSDFGKSAANFSLTKGTELLKFLGNQKDQIGAAWDAYAKSVGDQFGIMKHQLINARHEAVLKSPVGTNSEYQNSRVAHQLDEDVVGFDRGRGFNVMRENFRQNLVAIRNETAQAIENNKTLSGEEKRTNRLEIAESFHKNTEAVFKQHRHTVTAYKAIASSLKAGKPAVAAGHFEDFLQSHAGEDKATEIMKGIYNSGGFKNLSSTDIVGAMWAASEEGRAMERANKTNFNSATEPSEVVSEPTVKVSHVTRLSDLDKGPVIDIDSETV